ncbi:hypothetical protein JTE90_018771 [Oedothorax gibbosus]|uniref:Uncharacterized protein n=1 Tax=Oedothorax gibbosus TaxID=931172 RepID=A0AAV6UVD7_9ARAC|nr:hypothetical protein JTE90_018771 [Oedothorax gibbosus]
MAWEGRFVERGGKIRTILQQSPSYLSPIIATLLPCISFPCDVHNGVEHGPRLCIIFQLPEWENSIPRRLRDKKLPPPIVDSRSGYREASLLPPSPLVKTSRTFFFSDFWYIYIHRDMGARIWMVF